MLYGLLLFVHSWLRWVVLAGVIVLVVRAVRGRGRGAAWTARDDRTWSVVVGLAALQMVVGLVMILWASPIARAAWSAGLGAMFSEPVLLVFGAVHPLGMLVAVGALHGGSAKIRRLSRGGAPARALHAIALRSVVVFAVIVCATLPWPGLPWGRPLVRVALVDASGERAGAADGTRAPAIAVPPVYRARCASCHGESGRGDGPAAAGLSPRPRSFADAAWQATATDARLRDVITRGGAAAGMSPLMPPHADLDAGEVRSLVAFIRQLGEAR